MYVVSSEGQTNIGIRVSNSYVEIFDLGGSHRDSLDLNICEGIDGA